MSSKRCRIRFRSGDLISLGVTCDDEASVAKKTRPGKHTRATILRTFLVRRRYWTSLPCVVIPRRILAYGSASRPRQSQRTQLVSTWSPPGGEHKCPLNTIGTSTSRTIQGLLLAGVADHGQIRDRHVAALSVCIHAVLLHFLLRVFLHPVGCGICHYAGNLNRMPDMFV
jgi:hypothetical protein